jgi:ABC-type transport system involved in Fe-S cluster assembly fused permease/ATPase subunit
MRHQETTTCAAFIKESRMKLGSATKAHRKSGVWAPKAHPNGEIHNIRLRFQLSLDSRSRSARGKESLWRALLRDPRVLILDEPTSELDPAAEAAVIRQLLNVLRGRTSILITHRMSLAELADMLVVIEVGCTLESL